MTGPCHGEQAIPGPDAAAHFARVVRLAEVDSTNRYALEAAMQGAPEGLVVIADLQTAGRGRLGRRWSAPAGSAVLCSFLFRPSFGVSDLHLLPTLVAVAARRACRATAGVEAALKWPNDLIAADRKLAGILSELSPDPAVGEAMRAVVVGIGINVSWPPAAVTRADEAAAGVDASDDDIDDDLRSVLRIATSLEREAGGAVDREALIVALLDEVNALYRTLGADRPDSRAGRADQAARMQLMAEYRDSCKTIGERVRVDLLDESFIGTALDVSDEGSLLVATGACVRTVEAGDIVHLRPG